jgi:hypothetical protein
MFTSPGYDSLVVSTPENRFEKGLKMYPNPAGAYVTIRSAASENLNITAFDLSGRQVFQRNIFNSGRLDISDLAEGVYILRIADETGNRATKKLVVNK